MKDKMKKLGGLVSNAAKSLVDNAIQMADQNDDGKFDMSDVTAIAETVGSAMKKGTEAVMETATEKAKQIELKTLAPVFPDNLVDADFIMPKFIRVADRDKRRSESEVCQGSIGYCSEQKGLHIVNVFRDSTEAFGLSFYPDSDSEFYYVDPTDRDRYIALDEYFSYLKVARVNELQMIAQSLGAKYFRVTYKEEQVAFSENKIKGHAKVGKLGTADMDHSSMEKKYSTVDIAAEMSFPGHEPIKPALKYMQRDPSIQTLIAMRMDEKAPLMNQKYMLKMSNSSGMKEADAIKIDAAIKGFKLSGNATVASEAKNESRRYLEYVIEF